MDALINLASNALKFTTQGSIRIDVSSCAAADRAVLVKVAVTATGIGIAAQDIARMFQPFEQLAAGKLAGGTGLGLAISLAYARRMGGDLTVKSAPNVGSTFTLSFLASSGQGPEGSLLGRRQAGLAVRGEAPRLGIEGHRHLELEQAASPISTNARTAE